MKRVFFGLIVLAIGIVMLLRALGIVDLDWMNNLEWRMYIVPAVVILIGLRIVFGGCKCGCGNGHCDHHCHSDNMCEKKAADSMDDSGFLKIETLLSGQKYNLNGENFSGAKISAMLGGVSLDLRGANFPAESEIKVSAFMGGADIFVPKDVKVEVSSSCICGGVKNVKPLSEVGEKVLRIHAECLFGGVEIKY